MGVLCAKHQRRCLAYEEGKVIAGALNFISRSFLVRSCRGYYDDLRSVHLGLKDRCKGTASLEELGRSNKKTTQESIRYLRGGPNVVVSSNTAIQVIKVDRFCVLMLLQMRTRCRVARTLLNSERRPARGSRRDNTLVAVHQDCTTATTSARVRNYELRAAENRQRKWESRRVI